MSIKEQLARVVGYLRKGIAQSKEAHGVYISQYNERKGRCEGRACAVGAILIGKSKKNWDDSYFYDRDEVEAVDKLVPDFKMVCPRVCPNPHDDSCDCYESSGMHDCHDELRIGELAEHLFEDHDWHRGRIATFLERKIDSFDKEEKRKRVFRSQMKKESLV